MLTELLIILSILVLFFLLFRLYVINNENLKSKLKEQADNIEQRVNEKKQVKVNPIQTYPLVLRDSYTNIPYYLVIDCETDGLIPNYQIFESAYKRFPNIVSIAWMILDDKCNVIKKENHYFKLDKLQSEEAQRVHKLSLDFLQQHGKLANEIFDILIEDYNKCTYIVAHNIEFESQIIDANLLKNKYKRLFTKKRKICTMKKGKSFCDIPFANGYGQKYPKLEELIECCFPKYRWHYSLLDLHSASEDVRFTALCLRELIDLDVIK